MDTCLLSCALSLAGRIGQGENNWTLVEAGHVLDDLWGEHIGDGGRADQHCWLQLPDNVGKLLHGIMGMCEWHLMRRQTPCWPVQHIDQNVIRAQSIHLSLTMRPLESLSQTFFLACSRGTPSRLYIAMAISWAIPIAASPAPWNKKVWSCNLVFVALTAARMPARATLAVPWISSLKVQYLRQPGLFHVQDCITNLSLYFSRSLKAF